MQAERCEELITDKTLDRQGLEEFKKRDSLSDILASLAAFLIYLSIVILAIDFLGEMGSISGHSPVFISGSGIILAVLFAILIYIVSSPLSDFDFSRRDILFHYFVSAIERYENDNFEEVYKGLENLTNYLKDADLDVIHPNHQEILVDYVEKLSDIETEEKRHKIIAETFPQVVPEILEAALSYEEIEIRSIIDGIDEKTQQEASVTWGGIIISSIGRYITFDKAQKAAPYVLVASLGLFFFEYFHPQLGMLFVVVALPLVQQLFFSNMEEED